MALEWVGPAGPDASSEAPSLGHPWAWRVLAAGLVWGLVGAVLFRDARWGLNWPLALGLGAPLLAWALGPSAWRLSLWLPWAIAFGAAVGQAWRASPHLRLVDGCLLAAALAWPLVPPAASWTRRFLEASFEAFATLLGGAWALWGRDLPWAGLRSGRGLRDAGAVGLGLALALPFLLLFGGLMALADANFQALAEDALSGWPEGLAWAFWVALFAWPAWGYARRLAEGPRPGPKAPAAQVLTKPAPSVAMPAPGAVKPKAAQPDPSAAPEIQAGPAEAAAPAPQANPGAVATPPAWRWDPASREAAVATATALILVDMLFAAFVALQLPHLFGGAQHLASTPGLTAAQYARRGFFELSLLAALALPALVGAQAAARGAEGDARRLLQALSGAAALMLGAVLASAAHRMLLYAQAYGLTVARVEVLAAEAWGAFALLAFAATVLRWRPAAFAPTAFAGACVGLFALHLWPMEDAIVRHNLRQGVVIDDVALRLLSADALPALVAALPPIGKPERESQAFWLHERFGGVSPRSWREGHWGENQGLAHLKLLGPTHRAGAKQGHTVGQSMERTAPKSAEAIGPGALAPSPPHRKAPSAVQPPGRR